MYNACNTINDPAFFFFVKSCLPPHLSKETSCETPATISSHIVTVLIAHLKKNKQTNKQEYYSTNKYNKLLKEGTKNNT